MHSIGSITWRCLIFLEDNTDTSSNDDEIEMNSTLENHILEFEPKTESDVVVKEEKSIKKSKSTNGMYGVVIFFNIFFILSWGYHKIFNSGLLSVILCSTLVIILSVDGVLLNGKLLSKKAAIYGVEKVGL
jgi:hypothetical protein